MHICVNIYIYICTCISNTDITMIVSNYFLLLIYMPGSVETWMIHKPGSCTSLEYQQT